MVFLAFTTAFAVLQLAHNKHVFRNPVYEDLDYAANSLLVLKAKRFELLHGHYSRMGFYHPGPALLYVLAAAEWGLYDVTHIVPAPHNAHMIAHHLLNSVLLGIALTIVARAAGLRAASAAALAFLVYFAREAAQVALVRRKPSSSSICRSRYPPRRSRPGERTTSAGSR